MRSLDRVDGWPGEPSVAVLRRTGPRGPWEVTAVRGRLDAVRPWASVTKPATALAVLVAAEEGTLDLDGPAGPPGATVRHLLAHASGLGPDPGPPRAAPGRIRIYSNAGYAVLADHLAVRSGLAFDAYLAGAVLGPLGLDRTVLDPTAAGGPAGAGLAGPLTDLVTLALAWAAPTLVDPTTHADARSVQFPGLSGVLPGVGRADPLDWGLGVQRRGPGRTSWMGTGDPATYGHFGRSGSFLWLDPTAGVGCCGLSTEPFGAWSVPAWSALADAVRAEVGDAGRPPAGPE